MRQVIFHRSQLEISVAGYPGTVAQSAISFPTELIGVMTGFQRLLCTKRVTPRFARLDRRTCTL